MGQTRKRAFNALLTLLGDSNDPFENFMDAADAKRFKEENKQAPTSPMGSDYVEGDVIEKNPAEEDELEALGSDEDRNEDNDEALDDGSDSAVERDSAKLEIQGIQPLREDEEDDADEEDAEDALDDDDAYTDAAAAVHAPAASSAPSGDRTDEPEDARDPFEAHFADPGSFEAPEEWKSLYIDTLPQLGARSVLRYAARESRIRRPSRPRALAKDEASAMVKHRLKASFRRENRAATGEGLTSLQLQFATPLFAYQDVLMSNRTVKNSEELLNIAALHLLNHMWKTRDRVLRNNAEKNEVKEDLDKFRDQGYTRPKVLVILPTRNAAWQFVNKMFRISGLQHMEQQKRFVERFEAVGADFESKPADFRHLFAGNTNEMFCLGVKFTRQAMKLYTNFYASDMIVCSPLGLRMVIDKKGGDFLSSIEVCLADQLDAIAMQSWANVRHIFTHLNAIPTDMRDCDFSRVREWYLDGKAPNLRQTVLLAPFVTPEMLALYSRKCLNVAGKFRGRGSYDGAVNELNLRIRQVFHRVAALDVKQDCAARVEYLARALLPSLLRSATPNGILLVAPCYADYIVLRNFLESGDYSYVSMSEYSTTPHLSRGRTYFASGKAQIMLYSARLHHYRRYGIKGTKTVVFFGLPDNPAFYKEIVRFLARTVITEGLDPELLAAHSIFSRWDALKLERVVGTKSVGPLIVGRDDVVQTH